MEHKTKHKNAVNGEQTGIGGDFNLAIKAKFTKLKFVAAKCTMWLDSSIGMYYVHIII